MTILSLKAEIKKILITRFAFVFLGLVPLVLIGCFSLNSSKKTTIRIVLPPAVAAYSGPRVTVALADFDVKAAKATSEIGAQLRQMVVRGLTATNRFVLVERGDNEHAVIPAEGGEGPKTPELIISAAVTEFEPQVSGGSSGIGGGGGEARGALGGLLGSNLNKAHMALEIRVADAGTSKVLTTSLVQGQATDISGIFPGQGPLTEGLCAYARTPMEKAIRICVAEAIKRISESIPENYYEAPRA